MVKKIIAVLLIVLGTVLLAFSVSYAYTTIINGITVTNSSIEPLGRLSFVKFEDPDMYPGHPHSVLLAEYAEERGSACALVVHLAGSSKYRSYEQKINESGSNQSSVYIIEAAFIDTKGVGSADLRGINPRDSLKLALYGVPEDRYKYLSDGVVYNTYDELMNHVYTVARKHGQQGPIPMVWHGSVRGDNPNINPGCGFPLYFQILTKTYGLIPAYGYAVYGLIFPYIYDPYRDYELKNAPELQKLYNEGELSTDYFNITSNSLQNQTNNVTQSIINSLPNYE